MSLRNIITSIEKYLKDNLSDIYITSDGDFDNTKSEELANLYTIEQDAIVVDEIIGTVSNVNADEIEILWTVPSKELIYRYIEINGELRFIDSYDGVSIIYINEEFTTVNVGDNITLKPQKYIQLENYEVEDSYVDSFYVVYGNEKRLITAKYGSIIEYSEPFSLDILNGEFVSLEIDKSLYIYTIKTNDINSSRRYNKEMYTKVIMKLNVSDDSDNFKTWAIEEELRELFNNCTNSIDIYNEDLTEVISNMMIFERLDIVKLDDNKNDAQISLLSFSVKYFKKF